MVLHSTDSVLLPFRRYLARNLLEDQDRGKMVEALQVLAGLQNNALLQAPSKHDCETESMQVDRAEADFEFSRKFVTQEKQLAAQYADMYFTRLHTLKKGLLATGAQKWKGRGKVVDRILEAEVDSLSVVVGTVFKEMKLRPNILDEYNGKEIAPAAEGLQASNLISEDDAAVIEDESGRVTMDLSKSGIPKTSELVTGQILAVLGTLSEQGDFIVEDICTPGLPPQSKQELPKEDTHVLLLSGLQLGSPDADPLAVEMLVDYVTGNLGGEKDYSEASKIVKVIVAGDSCHPASSSGSSDKKKQHNKEREDLGAQQRALTSPIRELDMVLTRLCSSVPVDLLPGATDPCNVFLPQQPFHHCLLPSANMYSTFRAATNPYEATIAAGGETEGGEGEGLLIVGSSGQNVDDVLRYSTIDGSLNVLESMLQWRHVAPTAPDTLSCFPMREEDPFICERCPHIFFAGGQKEFGSRMVEGEGGQRCLVVAVPSFAASRSAVLVNLRTMQAEQLSFATDAFK